VRIARDAGDISSLFPAGIDSLADLPFNIFNLIAGALYFISFEELPKEERPRKSIWLDADLMEKHWAYVEALREDRIKGNDTSHMPRNSLIDELIVGD